jgi:hypothetical protein
MEIRALSDRMDRIEVNQKDHMAFEEYSSKKIVALLNALCEQKGIDPSSVPGANDPPPIRRSLSPHSPSIRSASSTGVGMSSLALSDSRSDGSAPSVESERSCKYLNFITDLLYLIVIHSAGQPQRVCTQQRFQRWELSPLLGRSNLSPPHFQIY